MVSYLLYNNTTGEVTAALTMHSIDDAEATMTANTPAGFSAIQVDTSSPAVVDQFGWTVQNGVLTPPTDTTAQQVASAKSAQSAVLTAAYTAAKTASVTYNGRTFMADLDSQQTFAHALLAYQSLGATPADFFVIDTSFNKVSMGLTDLQGLIAAIAASVWAAFQRYVSAQQQLQAATTVAQVQAVTF